MPYDEDYEYEEVQFDESYGNLDDSGHGESNGNLDGGGYGEGNGNLDGGGYGEDYGNLDDGSYGDDNEFNGNYQQHGRTDGDHESVNSKDDNEDDGARWPHADKTNADLDMLIDYVLSQVSAAGLNIDGDSDEDDSGAHDNYERSTEDNEDYWANEGGEMTGYQNGDGNEGSAEDEMW